MHRAVVRSTATQCGSAMLQAQSVESQGRALLARLDALPEGAIPVGCEADLRAIAEAMGSGE
jgi:hypothetical protein